MPSHQRGGGHRRHLLHLVFHPQDEITIAKPCQEEQIKMTFSFDDRDNNSNDNIT